MATSPVTLDLSKSQPIPSGVTLDLSKSQPLTKGPSAPEPSLTDRLTEIRPHQSGMSVGQHVVTALGNIGAGAMTPILHPVDTAIGAARMITDPYETMAYPLTHHPSQSMELANSLVHHPAGTIESGIGQAATMGGLSEIPPETASAPIRGAVKTINAAKRNAPAIMTPTLGTIGLATGAKFGLPEALAGGGYGAYKGMQLGKYIQKAPDIPGERFGLPSESEPPPVSPAEGGTVSRGTTIGASRTGAVPSPEQFIGNPTTTRPEAVPAPSKFAGGKFEPSTEPSKADTSKLGPPAGVGKYQPPERVPPPVRTAPIERTPAPVETAPPQVSMADQIATAKGLGFKGKDPVGSAISQFGAAGWQKYLGINSEPPSVRPGSPTPFHSDAPLTPADLGMVRNTRIPTWDEVERKGAKERFYSQAPMVKTKNQLVNEVQPSMVAKSEANTSPYADNLPTKKIRK